MRILDLVISSYNYGFLLLSRSLNKTDFSFKICFTRASQAAPYPRSTLRRGLLSGPVTEPVTAEKG